MSFLKKNLLFCIVALFCLAAFFGGVFLAFTEYSEVKEARQGLNRAEAQLSGLLNADPVPTEENLAVAENNLAELRATLKELRNDLQSGAELDISEDGVSVIAGIQQYISRFQTTTAAHENEDGEPAPIAIPDDFAFGFEEYFEEATPPEDPDKIALLDKQRQILSYLLAQLIKADPQSIDAVRREGLEAGGNKEKKGFSIDPAVTARTPGAIDTLAFSLTFSGYTDSLREFLNRLSGFDLPIVVRSIQVERPSGGKSAPPARRDNVGNAFDLFGEQGDAEPESEPTEAQKPVIEENLSQFTVILEFIEVVLPDAKTQKVSNSA